jgi:hypothetical protein
MTDANYSSDVASFDIVADNSDESLTAVLLESMDSYLEEQRSILRSIQKVQSISRQRDVICDAATSIHNNESINPMEQFSENLMRKEDQKGLYLSKSDCFQDDRCSFEQLQIFESINCCSSSINTSPTTATELSDDDVIQEQIRILQEIQSATDDIEKKSTPYHQNTSSCSIEPWVCSTSVHFSKAKDSQYEDQTLCLHNGVKMRVKGTKQVLESIANGEAVLTKCTSCDTVSQVSLHTKTLYCTQCNQISPVTEMVNDFQLARSIQHQEKEALYLAMHKGKTNQEK